MLVTFTVRNCQNFKKQIDQESELVGKNVDVAKLADFEKGVECKAIIEAVSKFGVARSMQLAIIVSNKKKRNTLAS